MHWNIRLVQYSEDREAILEIAEVYYNIEGKPSGFCMARASGATVDELHEYVDRMKEALAYPVLQFNKDFSDWDK
jgi:hypothetical protein